MNNIIIKIKNGFVADVYCTASANVIVVDCDTIKDGETFEERMLKAVIMMIEQHVVPEEIGSLVRSLVLERGKLADGIHEECAAPAQTAERVFES
ncbi:MAG TPA: hypothetical protein VL197_01900 [Nitrospirota bacterium]|nr:hypothetical protein [Nitrospirota bacterium]